METVKYNKCHKGRSTIIDELRGIAIILVVLGHVIQYVYVPNNFDNNFIFRVIYSFHMPLFMFISGYTSRVSHPIPDLRHSIVRACYLIIPFLFWGIISSLVFESGNCVTAFIHKIIYPENGLWFLPVLSEITIALFAAYKLSKKIGIWAYLLVNGLLLCIPINVLGLGLLKYYFTFYTLGYLLPLFRKKMDIKWLRIVCYCIFPITVIFWMRTEQPLFYDYGVNVLRNLSSSAILVKAWYVFGVVYRKYIVPLLGVAFVCMLYKQCRGTTSNRITSFIAYLGKHTIELYAMQWYFWSIIRTGNTLIDSIIAFAMSMICPLLLGYIFMKNKVCATITLGKKIK